jgi:hypothetical protein
MREDIQIKCNYYFIQKHLKQFPNQLSHTQLLSNDNFKNAQTCKTFLRRLKWSKTQALTAYTELGPTNVDHRTGGAGLYSTAFTTLGSRQI